MSGVVLSNRFGSKQQMDLGRAQDLAGAGWIRGVVSWLVNSVYQ